MANLISNISNAGFRTVEGGEIFNDYENSKATGEYSHAEGYYTEATGYCAHTEGCGTDATNGSAHAEGFKTKAYGAQSHTEGYMTKTGSIDEEGNLIADGGSAHAEGYGTTASGIASHSEGKNTQASGLNAHAEGNGTTASGDSSHSEGTNTTASGDYSHAEGQNTLAQGQNSHAEGYDAQVTGWASHVSGNGTRAEYAEQFVCGKYNNNKENTLFEVGNGTYYNDKRNAFEVYKDGHAEVQTQGETKESAVQKQYVDMLFEKVKLAAHPIGSYYWSSVSTDPAELFGGEWEQVKDRFVLAAGNNYSAGNTGGEAEHTLTVEEMPSHKHDKLLMLGEYELTYRNAADSGVGTAASVAAKKQSENYQTGQEPIGTSAKGGNQPHNNMPPYEVAYCWKRIA